MTLEIAIPTYNGAKTIGAAIESLLAGCAGGTTRVTVYDNASTDSTAGVVGDLMLKYSNLCLKVSPINLGFDGNILRCLSEATADYVWLFSDDDIAPPSAVTLINSRISIGVPLIVYLNNYQFYEEGMRGPPRHSCDDVVSRDGFGFFRTYDLGFLSSLIINKQLAVKYLGSIVLDSGQAHLSVVARICCCERGEFLFAGSLAVGARTLVNPRYNSVKDGFLNKAEFYEALWTSGVLSGAQYNLFIRGVFGPYFAYILLKDRAYGITSAAILRQRMRGAAKYRKQGGAGVFIIIFFAYCPSFLARLPVFGYSIWKRRKAVAWRNHDGY